MDYNNQGYQNNYQQNQGYNQPESDGAFGWEDEIEKEDAFTILPDGDYWFKIMKVEKGRYDGGDKISACPKAIVEFEVTSQSGDTVKITLKPWADFEDEYGSWNRSEFEDGDLILQEPCWGELATDK